MNKRTYTEIKTGTKLSFEGEMSVLESMLVEQGLVKEDIPTLDEIYEKLPKDSINRKDLLRLKFITGLNVVAKYLDLQYNDHILNSEELWVFDLSKKRMIQLTPLQIQNISKNKGHYAIALFRNEADAKYACKVLKDIIKELYE